MARYKEIEYPRTQVKKAGRVFASPNSTQEEKDAARVIINNWRAAHAFPLQIIYCNLKRNADNSAFIVAQRLKRLESITKKLSRFPSMSLSTMQDIGGCRIIVPTLNDVYSTVGKIKKSQWKHKFKEEYDYIENPKDDGYRCYHLVYSYRSDKNKKYNGLFIEIQIRTKVQHLWATAVETMDEVDNDELKIGNGKERNKEFFKLASTLMQLYEKDGYSVDAVRVSAAAKAMREFETDYHILNRLSTVRQTEALIDDDLFSEGYFLLRNNPEKQTTIVRFFSKNEVEEATTAYDNYEKERLPHESVVLVSTSSIDSLQKAYSNYFSNIGEFVGLINRLIDE